MLRIFAWNTTTQEPDAILQAREVLAPLTDKPATQEALDHIKRSGIWFVDVPRTSSSSTKFELGRRFGPAFGKANVNEAEFATDQLLPDHIPARIMVDLIGKRAWKQLYTFSFVRNPYERLFSLFHYLQGRGKIAAGSDFAEFVKELDAADHTSEKFRYYGLRCTMLDMLADEKDRVLVSKVFRFEEREAALREISRKVGFDIGDTHIQSAAKGKNYRDGYNEETRQIVARRYAKDLKVFGYRF